MEITLLILSAASLVISIACLAAVIAILMKNKNGGNDEKLNELKRDMSEKLDSSQRNLHASLGETIRSSSAVQQQVLDSYGKRVDTLTEKTEQTINSMRREQEEKLLRINETLNTKIADMQRSNDEKLDKLQKSNEEKLEQMRRTVDEKLQESLSKSVSESFKLVSSQLENVQKGLGEMQTLASDVGGLKKTLENAKTKGILGETQLARILEDILTHEQYSENIATRKGSADRVEFAVKLPGMKDDEKVYLPIDSKFPTVAYESLLNARENGDKVLADTAMKSLIQITKKNAKDIHDKYIDPPYTTEFAIMFLPTEGLFAEIVSNTELTDELRNKYKVSVAGPSTISAFLNSLQMGFRTLAIEKRSSEVWTLLGAVKTEFGKFSEKLQAVQHNFMTAQSNLDMLVGTRTRMMMSKLKNIDKLPEEDAKAVLGSGNEYYDEESDSANDLS